MSPQNLLFARERITRVRDVAESRLHNLDELDAAYGEIHRGHPFLEPPDFVASLRGLINAANFKSILEHQPWSLRRSCQGSSRHRVRRTRHGRSGKPHDAKAYGAEMSQDFVRLLDHLKVPCAHIIGYSMGAFIVGHLLTTDPERFLSATLVAHHAVYNGLTKTSGRWKHQFRSCSATHRSSRW